MCLGPLAGMRRALVTMPTLLAVPGRHRGDRGAWLWCPGARRLESCRARDGGLPVSDVSMNDALLPVVVLAAVARTLPAQTKVW